MPTRRSKRCARKRPSARWLRATARRRRSRALQAGTRATQARQSVRAFPVHCITLLIRLLCAGLPCAPGSSASAESSSICSAFSLPFWFHHAVSCCPQRPAFPRRTALGQALSCACRAPLARTRTCPARQRARTAAARASSCSLAAPPAIRQARKLELQSF